MARSVQIISPKLFMHFASATVAVTFIIALLADEQHRDPHGEAAREADEIAAREWADGGQQDSPEMIRKDDPNAGASWGSDIQTFGAPSIGTASRSGRAAAMSGGAIDDETLRQLGLTRAEFEALPPAEQAALLEQLERSGVPIGAQARQLGEDRIFEASRARSGVEGPSADAPF